MAIEINRVFPEEKHISFVANRGPYILSGVDVRISSETMHISALIIENPRTRESAAYIIYAIVADRIMRFSIPFLIHLRS